MRKEHIFHVSVSCAVYEIFCSVKYGRQKNDKMKNVMIFMKILINLSIRDILTPETTLFKFHIFFQLFDKVLHKNEKWSSCIG